LTPLGLPSAIADDPEIRPGAMIEVEDHGQCTANFVFEDGDGELLIGTAAHCVD
jgi:hypothetical protein